MRVVNQDRRQGGGWCSRTEDRDGKSVAWGKRGERGGRRNIRKKRGGVSREEDRVQCGSVDQKNEWREVMHVRRVRVVHFTMATYKTFCAPDECDTS